LQPVESGNVFLAKGVGGPLALSEVNGQMTLFWGARFVARRYPESAPSHLYRFKNGKWELDQQNELPLRDVGLVSGAVWSDLDDDGTPELILACEWGPVRVFSVARSVLVERTKELGLDLFTGLWQSVATGDFDGDGRMDIVAGNWGLNSFYNQAADRKVSLLYGDFNATGNIEMMEAYFDRDMGKTVPWRDKRDLSVAMPWLNEAFATHADFAMADVQRILGARLAKGRSLQAASLASAVFFNRGGKFEHRPLPRQAQYAPAFGLAVADFDNDGKTDLFLAQNFFAVREFDSRLDAGRGLLLKGSGNGAFVALSPAQSGILHYGEQRACATGDFDNDGRSDLLVSQYAGPTKLFSNKSAPAGIHIRFKGDRTNLAAAGAQFQIETASGWGPLQEVQIGSGYWSQSSLTQTVSPPKPGGKIRVRWPGTKAWSEAPLPNSRNCEISRVNGALQVNPY
jgi:hypothetical protein